MDPIKTEYWEKLDRLYNRLFVRFGKPAGQEILEMIMQEFGDTRVTISFPYYKRKVRNQQILKKFYGGNYKELGI